jgi:hypothetical protein
VLEREPAAHHETPAWRERADFLIGARLDEPGKWEQLWSRQLAPTRFELCCIPFLASGLALGDVVETEPLEGREFVIARVAQPSGRRTMRVWFVDTSVAEDVAGRLAAVGALLEWRGSWSQLLALDAADDAMTHAIAEVLRPYEAAGRLNYETGWS